MSWSKTYTHTLLIALDQFAAAIIFNRPDLTISTLCWLVRPGNTDKDLKLYVWQRWALVKLGPILDKIQANHCEQAKDGDRHRAWGTLIATRVGTVYGDLK
jgi:hypothetical protein